ncbi:MAG: GH3 auxin-responsive promoter family protein [Bacteroidales bacterium]|nr:GH3 auxin-responsive promoter family protein [Bacteroidales bacterium]
MIWFNSIVSWLNTKRLHQLDLSMRYPFDVQRETFLKLIEKAEDTEWGKKYGYRSVSSVEEFQKRVPVQDYEDVKPYIIRLRQGEKNLLWPGSIKWFAKSSGTTNDKSKFIPVSKEALEDCHFRGGKDVLAFYTEQFPETRLFKGKGLTLGGSHQINNFSNDSYYGDLSAILIQNLPYWVEFIRTPKTKVALMDKWEEKIEEVANETLRENVTSIAGVPSWTLVLIKYILEKTGKKNLLDVWPNLELFNHGGVSFTPYREQYKKLIPSENMNYLENYNASEGYFAIQNDLNDPGMMLMLDYGIFYEFIPMDEFGKKNPNIVPLEGVVLNKNYAIIISTNGGLWRYLIGDTVKFISKDPYKLIITGRTKHFLNAFGEEIIIENAEKAIQIACEKTNIQVNDYTAAPVFMGENQQGTHEWIFEFETEPNDLDYFISLLDNALQSVNSDYEAKRYKDITLAKPVIHSLPKGSFYKWLEKKGKLGGQNKIPRLSNDRKYVEELLEMFKS